MNTKIDMDDGSFPIARNLLLWLAKTKLSPSQRAVLDVILCQTYGFYEHASEKKQKLKKRKVKAKIPFVVFVKHTWLDRPRICRALKTLRQKNLITQDKTSRPYVYSFNVEVHQWAVDIFRKQLTESSTEVVKLVNENCQNSQQ